MKTCRPDAVRTLTALDKRLINPGHGIEAGVVHHGYC